jgi:hypothetical protein
MKRRQFLKAGLALGAALAASQLPALPAVGGPITPGQRYRAGERLDYFVPASGGMELFFSSLPDVLITVTTIYSAVYPR